MESIRAKHNNIHEALQSEKTKAKAIKRVFLFIDIILILMQLSTETILMYKTIDANS